MKKIFNIQNLPALLIILLAGCSKFIDISPETRVPSAQVDYTDLSQMYNPVSGVYGILRRDLTFWGVQGITCIRGDDVLKGGRSATGQGELTAANQFDYEPLKVSWLYGQSWISLYNVVTNSNSALVTLKAYSQNISNNNQFLKYKQYDAEVRFLRAYAYFQISNMWGDIPLITDNNDLAPKKTKLADVRKFLLDEMDTCSMYLPDMRPNQRKDAPGGVTKYSAMTLKAKLQLYSNDFAGVLATTDEIITKGNFHVYPDFYESFKIPGKLSDESLFEVQCTDFGSGTGSMATTDNWFVFQGPHGTNTPLYIGGWGFMTPTTSLINFFTSRGETVRAQTTFLYSATTTPSGDVISANAVGMPTCFNGKAYTPSKEMTSGRTLYGANNNVHVLRYADVLLMNAEAKVRLGQSGDAPLNIVRSRAHMPNLTNATLDNILDERRAEFAMEWGERFYDLLRTDQAKKLAGFVKGQSEYYPIPQAQIDLNSNLK